MVMVMAKDAKEGRKKHILIILQQNQKPGYTKFATLRD
jgi:hypothetical protein